MGVYHRHGFAQSDRYSATNLETGTLEFTRLAEIYGIKVMKVGDQESLRYAIVAMLAHNEPVLLNVRVTW